MSARVFCPNPSCRKYLVLPGEAVLDQPLPCPHCGQPFLPEGLVVASPAAEDRRLACTLDLPVNPSPWFAPPLDLPGAGPAPAAPGSAVEALTLDRPGDTQKPAAAASPG